MNFDDIKLGRCVVCRRHVRQEDVYIKAVEGYVHRSCLSGGRASA